MFTAGVTGIYLKPYQDPALFKPDADIVGIFMDYHGKIVLCDAEAYRICRQQGGEPCGLYSRQHARFMACADLGDKWKELANAPRIKLKKTEG